MKPWDMLPVADYEVGYCRYDKDWWVDFANSRTTSIALPLGRTYGFPSEPIAHQWAQAQFKRGAWADLSERDQ